MTTENYHAARALSTAVAPRGAGRASLVAQCESRIVTGSPPEPTSRPVGQYDIVRQNPMVQTPESAFAHKAGVHVSAIERSRRAYEHSDPAQVGNETRVL